MDVDNNEIDLISQFRSMRTNDKECLIEEFKRLSNTHLSNEGCTFYLDLANWNLNTALWAYYEYDAPEIKNVPAMKFICDVTVLAGEAITPNTKFIKKWRVGNCGQTRWPPGCNLRLISGANLSLKEIILVDTLNPEEVSDISVEMLSPKVPMIYQSQYRLFTPTGTPFGDPLWIVLNVEEDGVSGLAEQLNNVNMFENNAYNRNNLPVVSNNNNNVTFNFNVNNNNNIIDNQCVACNIKPEQPQQNYQIIEASSMPLNQFNTNQTASNNITSDDDKRPDFYDEMFS